MARLILAYLLAVAGGAWVVRAVELWQQGDDPGRAIVESAATLVGLGPGFPFALAVLFVPALVLAIELVHRLRAGSRGARAVVGAFSFAGWSLAVAIALAVLSRVVLVPEWLFGVLVVIAASGAGFSLLAFDGDELRAGRGLTLLALAVIAFVVLGSLWMAGRWGGPA